MSNSNMICYIDDEYINNLLHSIKNSFDSNYISPLDYGNIVLFIAECMNHIDELYKEEFINIGHKLCYGIKLSLEDDNNLSESDVGILSYLGLRVFAVNQFSKKTGMLNDFSKQVTKYYFEKVEKKVIKLMCFSEKSPKQLELITGISGCLYYMLDFEYCSQIDTLINFICETMKDISNFHLPYEHQVTEEDYERFPKGHFNLGISHGMISIAVALSRALYLNKCNNEQCKIIIDNILDVYECNSKVINGNTYWPDKIESITNNNLCNEDYHLPLSWCYGSLSINRAIFLISKNMKYKKLEAKVNDRMTKLFGLKIDQYYLISPSLCHGYSSVLSILSYSEPKDKDLSKDLIKIILNTSLENTCNNNIHPFHPYSVEYEGVLDNYDFLTGSVGIGLSILNTKFGNCTYGKVIMID